MIILYYFFSILQKLVQSLEKNTNYLISDKINNERLLHKSGSDTTNVRN